MKTVVFPIINNNRKDRQKAVHVAILDTGVDGRHSEIQNAVSLKKIADCQGFPESLHPLSDRNGHGTHGASVFMRIAPNAKLYIARIVHDNRSIPSDNEYASVVAVPLTRPLSDLRQLNGAKKRK